MRVTVYDEAKESLGQSLDASGTEDIRPEQSHNSGMITLEIFAFKKLYSVQSELMVCVCD